MDVRKEIEFFDRFEAEYGDYDVLGDGAYRRLLGLFRDLVRPRPGERCADLGCGTGAVTHRLRAMGLEMIGVDISHRSVSRARRAGDGAHYVVADIRWTGLATGSMDVIIYSGVLHHCPEREDRLAVLREGLRILKPGGRLFAFDPSAHSPSMWLYRDPRSPLYSSKGKTDNEILLTRPGLTAELQEAGFADVKVRGVSGTTFRYVEGGLARAILPLYNLYELAVRVSPLEHRLGTFLVSVGTRRG